MEFSKKQQARGFTLLELMITVAIVGIIATLAIPSYLTYVKKTYFSEVMHATHAYKMGVSQCYHLLGTFEGCTSTETPNNGIPSSISTPPNAKSAIGEVKVVDGVITAKPNTIGGLTADDVYTLTPNAANGVILWKASGKAVTDGLAK